MISSNITISIIIHSPTRSTYNSNAERARHTPNSHGAVCNTVRSTRGRGSTRGVRGLFFCSVRQRA